MTKISPRLLFLSGLFVLPAFLFQEHLLIKGAQTAAFIILCMFFNRRMLLLPPLIAFFSVTIMNILSPHGEVLATLGRFPITRLALQAGLHKALTFIGLLYLSKMAITRQTPLPGTLGTLIAKTFLYFEELGKQWKEIKEKKLLLKLDTLLIKLDSLPSGSAKSDSPSSYSRSISLIFALVFTGVNWYLFVLTYA